MELLIGKFNVTLDESGRICLPAYWRKVLIDEKLIITECQEDKCLWLYPAAEYKKLLMEVQDNTSPLNKNDRLVRRQLFNSFPVDIDKAGRIPVMQNYREFAGLTRDCIVLAQGNYIEIWDEERYAKSNADNEDNSIAASENLGNTLKTSRGVNR